MNLFTLTQPLRDRRWFGYIFGLFAVLLSLAIRVSLGDAALKFPFVIFIPPVVLTTFLGGVRPGIAAAALAGLIADLSLIAPPGSIWPVWPDGWIAMGFYTLTIGVDIALIQGMLLAFERAEMAERDLRLLNDQLERRVAERTEALERQEAEREAAEAQVRQLQKMEVIGQLTGGVAHDFNNILQIVLGNLGNIERQLQRGPQIEARLLDRGIKTAIQASERAAVLTSQLLAFSRQQPLAPKPLDVNRLIGSMSDLLHRTLGEAIELETILAARLWQTLADTNQLESAILNLAVNARDAMPDGGKLTVETANAYLDEAYAASEEDVRPGQFVVIAVSDTGTGMSSEVIRKAFDPFFTTKDVGQGTGLGLSQVYGFIKQSGGHAKIYSEVGEGTTVKLYLPRLLAGADAAEPASAIGAPLPGGEEVILVVEDEADVRRYVANTLRELGYEVIEAADGRAALRAIENRPDIQLLFTDVGLPGGVNGRQLAAKASRRRPDLKILYTTGYARNAIVHQERLDAGVELINKPFTYAALATRVRVVLEGGG